MSQYENNKKMNLKINDTFNKKLPADTNLENFPRQVSDACFSYVKPVEPLKPELVHVATEFAHELGISNEDITSEDF